MKIHYTLTISIPLPNVSMSNGHRKNHSQHMCNFFSFGTSKIALKIYDWIAALSSPFKVSIAIGYLASTFNICKTCFMPVAVRMDTDYLTEEAHEILPLAAGINDYLKADLGVMSYGFDKEDEYLKGMLAFLQAVQADPDEYRDSWCLDENIDSASLFLLEQKIREVLAIPYDDRTQPVW